MKESSPISTSSVNLLANNFEQVAALVEAGELRQAQALCEAIIERKPDHSDALHMLGVIAWRQGEAQRACELIGAAISVEPNNPIFLTNFGNALSDLGRLDEAIASFDKAIALTPDFASAYFNRGIIFQGQTRFDDAIADYERAIALRPNFADAYCNRGVVLFERGQFDAAIHSYDHAIRINPNYVKAYINRGNALVDLGKVDVAMASFAAAFKLAPDYPYLFGLMLHTRGKLCLWNGYRGRVETLKRSVEAGDKTSHPFPVLTMLDSPDLQRRAAETWMQDKCPAKDVLGEITSRIPGDRIRVGYYSADFREHAVSYLTAQLFETHNKSKFELYGFSFTKADKDSMGRRIAEAFEHFFDVTMKTDREIAELSRTLGIDIAIDLNGHTLYARPGIFSYRAAPVQCSYLGYLGSMGASYFDYLIADRSLVPEAARPAYTEKIVYLPCYQVNDGLREIAPIDETRTAVGLPSQGFVFCCFSLASKITPITFNYWMQILRSVDDSVLWLADHGTAANQNLCHAATKRGVDATRIIFAKRQPRSIYLARLQMADLFLDTLPYNAGTMASDALWAGLPVLSLQGESVAARMGTSVLTAIDLPELIVSTPEHYVSLAIELASNAQALQNILQKLQQNRSQSLLFDCARFTDHLETAYQMIHERQVSGLLPNDIVVDV